ncbi:hypothetical protein ACFYU9_33825 [Streptomyces sp. NPDC004327]|uniref:hypothetical protein n=1 Tax=unclassified Streptomyces TaxID=2593676 RepID=UPI0036BCCF1A
MERGDFAYDEVACVVGEFRGLAGPYAMLRPLGGGREWQADPAHLRPATQDERLSAGIRAVNERARAAAVAFLDVEVPAPPVPVPGCAECDGLADRRRAARLAYDFSAETDANVLLRRHLAEEHVEGGKEREVVPG